MRQVMALPGFAEQPVFLQRVQNAFASKAFQRLPGQVDFLTLRVAQLRQIAQGQGQGQGLSCAGGVIDGIRRLGDQLA